jgi:hypothetical protein
MFVAGDVVKNKLNSKLATVTERLEDDMIRVRFDGDTGTVELHASRFQAHTGPNFEQPFEHVDPETFKKGDYIRVRDAEQVVQGAALSDIGTFGYASFDILTDDGQYLEFNSNYVDVVVLFRADIARGQMPKY